MFCLRVVAMRQNQASILLGEAKKFCYAMIRKLGSKSIRRVFVSMRSTSEKFKITFISLAIIICLLSCRQKDPKGLIVDSNIIKLAIIDDGPPLTEIIHIESITSDSMIILDNTHQLYLYVKNRFNKILGAKGKGPYEYDVVRSFTSSGDTLFIYDQSLSKLISYSISTNECLQEIRLEDLFSSVARIKGIFYFGYTEYTAATNLSKPLLYQLDAKHNVIPLKIRFLDLHANVFPAPLKMQTPLKQKNDLLYFSPPFSNKVFVYDTHTRSFSFFDLVLDSPHGKDFKSISNAKGIMKFINEELELVFGLFLLENYIAVVSKKGRVPDDQWKIRFYTYSGKYKYEITTNKYVFAVDENSFSRLTLALDNASSDHPYVALKQHYKIID
jgi:hypothetical protein